MAANVIDTSMSGPTAASMLLHIVIVGFFMVGTPYFHDDVIHEQPVSVDIVTVDEITQTNRAPLDAPKPKRKSKPDRPPLPASNEIKQRANRKKPAPPKNLAKAVQAPAIPQKPDVGDELAALQEPKKPDPIVFPDEPDKNEAQPEEKNSSQSIENLLVSLVGEDEPVLKDITPDKETAADEQAQPEPAPDISRMSDKLTISETDALRQQLHKCWNFPVGAKNAEDLIVQIRLEVNPDRTLQSARLIDSGRYNRDSFYRAAADSAMRAVRNPICNPLRLPPDKYDEWKTITVRFDPSQLY